jgi:hypothetical protein
VDGVESVSTVPSAAAPYFGEWLLLSAIDAGEQSHSQVVMLRSAQKQFRPKGLRVVLLGAVPPDLAYDWHLEDIPLLPGEPNNGGGTLPWTRLISPDRKVVRQWRGFVPPGDLGMALRHFLGDPNFAEMESPGTAPRSP